MSDLANTRRNPDIVDNATDWIAKLDRGLTGDEERRFKAWLFESDGNYAVFMELAKLWDRMDILESLAVTREDSERRPGGGWRKALPIAASIAAIALASAWIASNFEIADAPIAMDIDTRAVYETDTGARAKYELEDGSRIVLNTNTRVTIDFTSTNRFLHLDRGEIHIQVASDPSRPLSVYSGGRVVQAVGTEFNVEISDDKSIEIVVSEGVVMVGVIDGNVADRISAEPIALPRSSTLVAAGQEVVVRQGDDAVAAPKPIEDEEIAVKLSWREGNLIFRGEPLEEAISEVSRYTAVEFIILDEAAKKERVAGLFRAGDVDGLLEALRQNFNITYERIADNQVILGSAQDDAAEEQSAQPQ